MVNKYTIWQNFLVILFLKAERCKTIQLGIFQELIQLLNLNKSNIDIELNYS